MEPRTSVCVFVCVCVGGLTWSLSWLLYHIEMGLVQEGRVFPSS